MYGDLVKSKKKTSFRIVWISVLLGLLSAFALAQVAKTKPQHFYVTHDGQPEAIAVYGDEKEANEAAKRKGWHVFSVPYVERTK